MNQTTPTWDYSAVERPNLPYRTEFEPHELDAMKACCDAHGFAIVKGVLDEAHVEALKQSVREACDPDGEIKPGQTLVSGDFVEHSQPLLDLMNNAAWLRIQEHFLGSDQLTIHRSAAILKNVGAPPLTWHTDWRGYVEGAPSNPGEVLNRGEGLSGAWFYLNGTRPNRAGLAVIEDSHTLDWAGPQGFEFTPDRISFYPAGEEPREYNEGDVPGIVPLFTEPGDLILFAARTYHWAYPHNGDEARMSCGLVFRAGQEPFDVPWELPEGAQKFRDQLPPHLQPYAEHYTGIERKWKPETAAG